MKISALINSRVFLTFVAVTGLVVAIGCQTTPTAPTSQSITVTAPTATAADLAGCFGGNGSQSCFNTSSMVTAAQRVSPAVAPGAPTSLTPSVSGNTVTLTWAAPSSGDPVLSYALEAGTAPGLANLVNFLTYSTATGITVPGVPNGVYYVRVRAANYSGFSPPSNEVTVVVGSTACAGPPQNLSVAGQSAGTISIAWQAPATGSPSSYVISAGSSPGLSNLANFNTGNANTAFTQSGIPAGSYYVRVHSLSNCGLSAASNEVLVFVVGFTGDVQVSVSWDAPSDVDLHVVEPNGEEIYYGNPSSATGGQLDVDSNAACDIDGRQIENIRWSGAAPAGTYTVRVDYWDSCGVARTNYLVTVKNGPAVQTFSGFFTGGGDRGGLGDGVLITTFVHAASDALRDEALKLFRAPNLFTPSPAKVKTFHGGR